MDEGTVQGGSEVLQTFERRGGGVWLIKVGL